MIESFAGKSLGFMDFTFGIITDGRQDERLNLIIDTIEKQEIPKYEIIVVGNTRIHRDKTSVMPFDESIKPKWITKKKNIIIPEAQYENIVLFHDYVGLCDGWYKGYQMFGNDFHVCMNPLYLDYGLRGIDWLLCPFNHIPDNKLAKYLKEKGIDFKNGDVKLPYDITHLSKYMFIPGNYFIVKKHVMEEFPLDENRVWNQMEDVEWSLRVNQKYNFSLNTYSMCRYIQGGRNPGHSYVRPEMLNALRAFSD